ASIAGARGELVPRAGLLRDAAGLAHVVHLEADVEDPLLAAAGADRQYGEVDVAIGAEHRSVQASDLVHAEGGLVELGQAARVLRANRDVPNLSHPGLPSSRYQAGHAPLLVIASS